MFNSIAYAQDAAAGAAGGPLGSLSGMLPFVVMIVIFYFLLIRPNKKRQKEQAAVIDSLKAGDAVMTTSGFIATIDSVIDTGTFVINLGGTKVRIVKAGIAGKYSEAGATSVESK